MEPHDEFTPAQSGKFARVVSHHGAGDPDHLFGGNVATSLHPPGKRRYSRDLVTSTVRSVLHGETHPEHVDPRYLHSTQTAITRAGVKHYVENPTYHDTGETYADQDKAGNRLPVIHESRTAQGGLHRQILSGHHRAAAAVLSGKPLLAIVVREH